MKLVIETFQPHPGEWGDGSWIAIATPDGALLSESGLAGAITERRAVHDAINSYFTRRDDAAEAKAARKTLALDPVNTPNAEWETKPAPAPSLNLLVAVSPAQIKAALQSAVADNDGAGPKRTLTMSYEKEDGTPSVRDIIPYALDRKRAGFGHYVDYLDAIDVDVDEPRTFRLDRITRIERF